MLPYIDTTQAPRLPRARALVPSVTLLELSVSDSRMKSVGDTFQNTGGVVRLCAVCGGLLHLGECEPLRELG